MKHLVDTHKCDLLINDKNNNTPCYLASCICKWISSCYIIHRRLEDSI